MYETVDINVLAQLETLLRTLQHSPRVASLIKTLGIDSDVEDAALGTDRLFLDCLRRLPSLEVVKGLEWSPDGVPATLSFKRPILKELHLTTFRPSPLSRWFDLSQLQSLETLCGWEDAFPIKRLLEEVPTSLRSLSPWRTSVRLHSTILRRPSPNFRS